MATDNPSDDDDDDDAVVFIILPHLCSRTQRGLWIKKECAVVLIILLRLCVCVCVCVCVCACVKYLIALVRSSKLLTIE